MLLHLNINRHGKFDNHPAITFTVLASVFVRKQYGLT